MELLKSSQLASHACLWTEPLDHQGRSKDSRFHSRLAQSFPAATNRHLKWKFPIGLSCMFFNLCEAWQPAETVRSCVRSSPFVVVFPSVKCFWLQRSTWNVCVWVGFKFINIAAYLSWLERVANNPNVMGSSPILARHSVSDTPPCSKSSARSLSV